MIPTGQTSLRSAPSSNLPAPGATPCCLFFLHFYYYCLFFREASRSPSQAPVFPLPRKCWLVSEALSSAFSFGLHASPGL